MIIICRRKWGASIVIFEQRSLKSMLKYAKHCMHVSSYIYVVRQFGKCLLVKQVDKTVTFYTQYADNIIIIKPRTSNDPSHLLTVINSLIGSPRVIGLATGDYSSFQRIILLTDVIVSYITTFNIIKTGSKLQYVVLIKMISSSLALYNFPDK